MIRMTKINAAAPTQKQSFIYANVPVKNKPSRQRPTLHQLIQNSIKIYCQVFHSSSPFISILTCVGSLCETFDVYKISLKKVKIY